MVRRSKKRQSQKKQEERWRILIEELLIPLVVAIVPVLLTWLLSQF